MLVSVRQRFAFADSLLDFTALSNALGVNTPSRAPNDPIRPPAVSLDHLHCFLPIAHSAVCRRLAALVDLGDRGCGACAIPPYRKPPKTDIAFIGRFASKSALANLYDKEKVVVHKAEG